MKANYYKIITECIDHGISLGYNRAYKHTDKPENSVIKEKISDAIMELISENFIFDNFE
jgi:hypothetical protein